MIRSSSYFTSSLIVRVDSTSAHSSVFFMSEIRSYTLNSNWAYTLGYRRPHGFVSSSFRTVFRT